MNVFVLLLSGILIHNFIFVRFLGTDSFFAVSRHLDTAFGTGVVVTLFMTVASAITWLMQVYVLEALGVGSLQTAAFILVLVLLHPFAEFAVRKSSPSLYHVLGTHLPMITINCAVLGATVLNIREEYSFLQAVVNGFASGAGFLLAIVLFAGVREKISYAKIPKALQGFPILFISAGLMSVAFYGFNGLFRTMLMK